MDALQQLVAEVLVINFRGRYQQFTKQSFVYLIQYKDQQANFEEIFVIDHIVAKKVWKHSVHVVRKTQVFVFPYAMLADA